MSAASPPGPPIAVIVPVHNGAATLGACLAALARQTVAADRCQVIVVDDGSSDRSAEIAEKQGATVVRQARGGAAAARNAGARQANSQILLFTDADCEPLPTWIEQMVAPFADARVAGAKGTYLTRQRSSVARFTQAEYEEKYDRLARQAEIDFVDTYAAAYRRAVFDEMGGFDTSFPNATVEDQEFSYRLARAGHRLVFVPAAQVYHHHPATVRRYAQRKIQIGRWKVKVHAQHPGKMIRDSYTPWTQKAQLVLLPLVAGAGLVTGLGLAPWPIAVGLAALGLLSALPLMGKAARHGPAVLLAAPALVLVRAAALDLGVLWGLADRLTMRRASGPGRTPS